MLSVLDPRPALAIAALWLPLAAAAFPDKTIEWVVSYPAGDGSDVVACTLAEPMDRLGQEAAGGCQLRHAGCGQPAPSAAELFRERSGLKLTQVPYRGTAPAVQDVVGGQVPFMFVDTAGGYAHIQSGKLRVTGFDTVPTLALADQGLARKEASDTDGRGIILTLTAKGKRVRRRVMDVVERRNDEIVSSLDATERWQLDCLLDRLVEPARAVVDGTLDG